MRNLVSITFIAFVISLTAAINIAAQTEGPSKPVVVTNTPANPVPVTGQMNIGTMPAVDAKQSGTWNVGLTGTPTVKLDPNSFNQVQLDTNFNTVKLDPNANTVRIANGENPQRVETINWTGQGSGAVTTNINAAKFRVCIAHAAANPIQVNVFSLIAGFGGTSAAFFTYDAFVINSPSTQCRLYELPGVSTQILLSNTGDNVSGLTRVGIVYGN